MGSSRSTAVPFHSNRAARQVAVCKETAEMVMWKSRTDKSKSDNLICCLNLFCKQPRATLFDQFLKQGWKVEKQAKAMGSRYEGSGKCGRLTVALVYVVNMSG